MTPISSSRRTKCDLFRPGHCLHWLAAKHASRTTPRTGRLVALSEGSLTVEYLDRTTRYRGHDIGGLRAVAEIGAKVRVFEDHRLLGYDIDHWHCRMFGIALDEDQWTPCSYEPLTDITPEALADRLETRGGFSVSGESVVGWSK